MIGFGFVWWSNGLLDRARTSRRTLRPQGRNHQAHACRKLSGAKPASQQEVIAEAKQRASQRHPNVEHLAVALSNDAEHAHRSHRIDPKTKRVHLSSYS
jgi:hypothetical protein